MQSPQRRNEAPSAPEIAVPIHAHIEARPAKLLRLPEVMQRVGLKRSAIDQRMAEGRFPKSRSIGLKCAVWVEAAVENWIREIAAPGTSHIPSADTGLEET